ncbi:PREDICTED: protein DETOXIFICATION 29 isoform X2 [Ipomoea nil]|uniref:protein DETOXIFICATION 29 isoform X2 n=1 Tax=Ipomoea nil TaxID=35883 RepID=UPI000901F715|nr:PREDICTED: protein DETOXIFICATION 29 isoform X2 [Ipomoea nil]
MSSVYSFDADAGDIRQIKKVKEFIREFYSESKKLWYLAAPAIFTIASQYSIGAITQVFAGHVGNIQLAAVAVENNLIAGFAFGIMYGMGSALETLCGQAFGAKKLEMLGVYLQRSWIILNATAIPLTTLYIFSTPILKLLHQNPHISKAVGTFAVWMIPQLFAYVFTFPIQRFLQSQSKIYVMASVSDVALVGHVLFSWLFMLKLRWGLPGGAVVLNTTWWFMAVAQFVYVVSGACGDAWKGFSQRAFQNLTGFVRLSLASGVMFCLELWYFVALILIAGYTKNAEVSVDGTSICMNISGWTLMVGVGFSAAISVRVSNELGAGHPRTAKFSVVVATATSLFTGIILGLIPILFRSRYPPLFSKSSSVQKLVYDLIPLLGFTIALNSLQPTLSGVAIGAGWQSYVAYVNIVCYYLVGIPIGLLLGFVFNKGVKGIWYGMIAGTVVQTIVLIVMVLRTNWNKEASLAGERMRKWGGDSDSQPLELH